MNRREDILALREKYKRKVEPVTVDGQTVFVHEMSMATKLDFNRAEGGGKLVLIVMDCVRDEEGRRLFSAADIDIVRDLPEEFTVPVWKAAVRVSGLVTDEEAAGTEEGKAPSPSGTSSGSSSG